jgi:hypothetical protein
MSTSRMLDAFLTEALRRLDACLLDVCDDEARRAKLLAGDGSQGWAGVRNLARLAMGDLSPSEPGADESLLPPTGHMLRRIGGALQVEECELEALLVALSPRTSRLATSRSTPSCRTT